MIGELMRLQVGTIMLYNLNKEKSCTFTIVNEHICGAGSSANSYSNYKTKKSWSFQAQCLFDLNEFVTLGNLWDWLNNDNLRARLRVKNGSRYKYYTGNIILTKFSFAGQGKGVVLINLSAVGNGSLTIT